jgi:hypothetical protein
MALAVLTETKCSTGIFQPRLMSVGTFRRFVVSPGSSSGGGMYSCSNQMRVPGN